MYYTFFFLPSLSAFSVDFSKHHFQTSHNCSNKISMKKLNLDSLTPLESIIWLSLENFWNIFSSRRKNNFFIIWALFVFLWHFPTYVRPPDSDPQVKVGRVCQTPPEIGTYLRGGYKYLIKICSIGPIQLRLKHDTLCNNLDLMVESSSQKNRNF